MRKSVSVLAFGALLVVACGRDKRDFDATASGNQIPLTGGQGAQEPPDPQAQPAATAEPAPAAADAATGAATDAGAGAAADAGPSAAEAPPKAEPLTMERLERLVRAVGACELISDAVDPKCEALTALYDALGGNERFLSEQRVAVHELAMKLLSEDKPALRIQAIDILRSSLRKPETLAKLIAVFQKKDEAVEVRLATLNALAKVATDEPKAMKLLEKALADDDVSVRGQAIRSLAIPKNKKVEGLAGRLIKLAERDKDRRVRAVACEYAGLLGDEAILPVVTKLVAPDGDAELQGHCLRGLISMWADAPDFDNASDKAHALTMEILQRTPRNQMNPSWAAIAKLGEIGVVSAEPDPNPIKERWKNRVRRWYNPFTLRTALEAIVLDEQASDRAAVEALNAMVAHGMQIERVELLKMRLNGTARLAPDGIVAKAFDKHLGVMKKSVKVDRKDGPAPAP